MATTTNYSWTTPDDTDLVKDGAAAIRTLGSSIDTSVKALSPGTTAGDIDYYTTSTAKARVGIGTAGQVLQVNSGATAPEWATPSSGGMTLISTTTLTGASVTLSSIPATYKDLLIIIRDFKPTDDSRNLRMRFNADATASRHASTTTLSTSSNAQTFSADDLIVAATTDNTSVSNLSQIYIPDYANATTWKMMNNFSISVDPTTATSFRYSAAYGFYNQTAAISSLKFNANSGDLTSGSVLLYGVK
jgi:hypothetical protein